MLPQDKVDREKMLLLPYLLIHQFPAQFDHSKTLSSADEGLVRLTCPPEFQKMCGKVNDHQWRWGLSGSKLNDIGQVIIAGLNCSLSVQACGCEFSTRLRGAARDSKAVTIQWQETTSTQKPYQGQKAGKNQAIYLS